jgi:hypothetical protein
MRSKRRSRAIAAGHFYLRDWLVGVEIIAGFPSYLNKESFISTPGCRLLTRPALPLVPDLATHNSSPTRMAKCLALLLLLAVVFLTGITCTQCCSLPASGPTTFYNYSAVSLCLSALPFNDYIRATTIDSLTKSLALFTFLELAANPPRDNGLDTPSVILEAELARISLSAQYSNDFEFQNDLVRVYGQLNDAHSLYFRPKNYAALTFYQPFNLIHYTDAAGTQIIAISQYFLPGIADYYRNHEKIELQQFAGAQLVEIEGIPALEYLEVWAAAFSGLSKDSSSRFNFALARFLPLPEANNASTVQFHPGFFSYRRGLYGPIDQTSQPVSYLVKLVSGQLISLEFPWIATTSVPFPDLKSWEAAYYNSGEEDLSRNNRKTALEHKNSKFAAKLSPARRSQKFSVDVATPPLISVPKMTESSGSSLRNERALGDSYKSLGSYDVFSAWALNDGKTMVVWLSSMEPQLNSEGVLPQQFIATVAAAFDKANSLGLTHLIVDLTDNGGGIINFGLGLIEMLYNKSIYHGDTGFSPSDMPISDFTATLAQKSAQLNDFNTIWSAGQYQSYPGLINFPNSNISWFLPGVERQRGAGFRRFSQVLDLDFADLTGFTLLPIAQSFPRSNIVISTKGFCGSTCALFSGHSKFYENITTVVSGGLAARKEQQFFAFPGIQVVDSPDFYAMFSALKLNITAFSSEEIHQPTIVNEEPLTPRELVTSAGYRYCIREQYERAGSYNLPTEYSFVPADYHWPSDFLMTTQPQTIWEKIADNFWPQKKQQRNKRKVINIQTQ